MNWYLTKIVYRIICGEGKHKPQFEEQARLVSAVNKLEAYYKASQLGRQEEDSFFNGKNQLVQWQFIDVCEIFKIQQLIDGAELYSRIDEHDDAESHIRLVHKRAESIMLSDTRELLQLV